MSVYRKQTETHSDREKEIKYRTNEKEIKKEKHPRNIFFAQEKEEHGESEKNTTNKQTNNRKIQRIKV